MNNNILTHRDCTAGDLFDEDYFLRGRETGKSLYTNYRWMPDLTIPMVQCMARHLGLRRDCCTILDFGCARGYTVKALRHLGYTAFGCDVSRWAIDNADPATRQHLGLITDPKAALPPRHYDWIIAKDVLEHVEDVVETVGLLRGAANVGIFAVVPLATELRYDVPEYEEDVTHLHRYPLFWWASLFLQPGWSVDVRYRLPGIKDNYRQYPTGNGFITARRVAE